MWNILVMIKIYNCEIFLSTPFWCLLISPLFSPPLFYFIFFFFFGTTQSKMRKTVKRICARRKKSGRKCANESVASQRDKIYKYVVKRTRPIPVFVQPGITSGFFIGKQKKPPRGWFVAERNSRNKKKNLN